MRLYRMLSAMLVLVLSGCWTSYRYRANLDSACASEKLKSRYCITRVDYCPWPLEEGISESVYEGLRAAMEKTLREVYPELFAPGGEPVAVSMRSVASETTGSELLVALNAFVSFVTLGVVPVAGGFTDDFIVATDLCGNDQGQKVHLVAENFGSAGFIPTALLHSYANDPSAQFSAVGTGSIAERDRQAKILVAKVFGAAVVQLLSKYEMSPKPRQVKVLERPVGSAADKPERNGDRKTSVVEIEQIPL